MISTRRAVSVSVLAGLMLAVSACSSSKIVPDEFEVVDRAPLVLPPEAELVPPRPGEPRAQEIDPGRQAFEALFPGQRYTRETAKSVSEQLILSQLASSDPDVRAKLAQKDLDVVKKRLLLAEILDADDRQFAPDNVQIRTVSNEQ